MFRRFVLAPEGDAGSATGGQGADSGNSGAGNAAGAGETAPWYGKFSEENRGYIEAKGFKGAEDVVTSYRGAEKLLGVPKEKLLRVPDKEDAPEWSDIYNRLGRPENSDGYQVDIPEGGSEEFGKWAKGVFHGLGLTKKQGDKLAAQWNQRADEAAKAEEASGAMESHKQFDALKSEWGAAFEPKVRAANEFAKLSGVTPEMHDKLERALGVDGYAKLMDSMITKFGIKLGEHQFKGGGGGNNFGAMTPAGAKAALDMKLADPAYRARYIEGGVAEREEVGKLHEYMASSAD